MANHAVPGAFVLEDEKDGDGFNLRPRPDRAGGIPDDQREVSHGVYEARNILKLLNEGGAFNSDQGAYDEFIRRIIQAAKAGCDGPNVDTKLAAAALEQIRKDVVRRKGRPLAFRYLCYFLLWALGGAVVALLAVGVLACIARPELMSYAWVVVGAMAGVWVSTAAGRWEVSFEGMQDYLDISHEPFIRVLFVALLTLIVALLVAAQVLPISFANVKLADFTTDTALALILGVVVGFSERLISVELIDRARKVLRPGSTSD